MKIKKLYAKLLFQVNIPIELLRKMSSEDRARLRDLNILTFGWRTADKAQYIFHLGDVFKVREVLMKYGYTVAYPKRSELNRYGLSYSGESLEIKVSGNDFIIHQQFPDGRIETHIIPKDRVFRVYYIIVEYFKKHPELEKVTSSVIWEELCRAFNIRRFFDRSGKFHANSFFGDRRTYFDFAYYPLKVLQHIGKIKYAGKYIYNPSKGVI